MGKEAAICPFIFTGSTLELRENLGGDSYEYERACLYWLTARLKEEDPHIFAIGARLTEKLINDCRLSRLAKPDILVFRNGSSCWKLHQLVEVKSVRPHGIENKLKGFSTLLKRLRRNPSLLVDSLARWSMTIPVKLPSKIVIPQDRQVGVTFISPALYHQQDLFPTHFPVSFVQY